MEFEENEEESKGSSLFDRRPVSGYRKEWKELLMRKNPEQELRHVFSSVVIFRLGKEWFALKTDLLREVHECRPVHSIPKKSNAAFRGLVNIRGRLRMCVSLHHLLNIKNNWDEGGHFVVIRHDKTLWVSRVDAVAGVQKLREEEIVAVPATVSSNPKSLVKGMFEWKGQKVAFLDAKRVTQVLKEAVL